MIGNKLHIKLIEDDFISEDSSRKSKNINQNFLKVFGIDPEIRKVKKLEEATPKFNTFSNTPQILKDKKRNISAFSKYVNQAEGKMKEKMSKYLTKETIIEASREQSPKKSSEASQSNHDKHPSFLN